MISFPMFACFFLLLFFFKSFFGVFCYFLISQHQSYVSILFSLLLAPPELWMVAIWLCHYYSILLHPLVYADYSCCKVYMSHPIISISVNYWTVENCHYSILNWIISVCCVLLLSNLIWESLDNWHSFN